MIIYAWYMHIQYNYRSRCNNKRRPSRKTSSTKIKYHAYGNVRSPVCPRPSASPAPYRRRIMDFPDVSFWIPALNANRPPSSLRPPVRDALSPILLLRFDNVHLTAVANLRCCSSSYVTRSGQWETIKFRSVRRPAREHARAAVRWEVRAKYMYVTPPPGADSCRPSWLPGLRSKRRGGDGTERYTSKAIKAPWKRDNTPFN